jgi:hypothetical protein
MKQLQIESICVEYWGTCHPKLDIQLSELVVDIDLPDRLSIDGITSQYACAEKAPYMFAIGAG